MPEKRSSKSDSTPPASAPKPDTAESDKLNASRIAELVRQLESERVAHASTRAELDQVKADFEAASTTITNLKTRGKDTLDNLQKQLGSVTVERDEAFKKIAVLEKPSASSKTTSSATPGPALLKPKSADSEITLMELPPKPTAVEKPSPHAGVNKIHLLIAAEYSRAVAPALKRAVEEPPKPAAVEKPSSRAIDRLIAAEYSRTVAPAPKDGARAVVDNSRTIAPTPKDGGRAAVSVAPSVTTVTSVVSPDALDSIMRRLAKFEAMEKRLEALEGGFKDHGTRIQGLDEAVEEHSEGLAVINKSVRFLHGRMFGKDELHAPATDGAAEVPAPSAEIESAAPGPAMAAPAAVEGASPVPAEGVAASPVPAEGVAASTAPAEEVAASTAPAEGEAASTAPAEEVAASTAPAEGEAASTAPAVAP